MGLGHDALAFVDFLASASMSVWQMLPVGEVDETGSPYQSCSLYAGRGAFIDWEEFIAAGLVEATTDEEKRLEVALDRFSQLPPSSQQDYAEFRRHNASWLEDYTLFRALNQSEGAMWWTWPAGLRNREPAELERARRELAGPVNRFAFEQFLFDRQWIHLREHAAHRGVELYGDVPIYPALDSADVWSNRALFLLDEDADPLYVAGVPPDAFSETGQHWGNPVYDWDEMQRCGFKWWLNRFRNDLRRFDRLRLDHFRGFEACWQIYRGSTTAAQGFWRQVPGRELLETARREFPNMPFIAEDLGVITPAVEQLRDDFGLPGIRVLQFAVDDGEANPHRPDNLIENCVVFTGTHDNDTTLGFYESLDQPGRRKLETLFGFTHDDPLPSALVKAALESPAALAILPMQDLLELDSEARMNTPGTTEGNWRWQFHWQQVPAGLARKISHMLDGAERTGPSNP